MDYLSLLKDFAAGHQQLAVGLVAGAVLSNPGTCALLLFNALVAIPWFGSWVGRNPDKAKAWADQFDKTIDAKVDEWATKQKAAQAAAQTTAKISAVLLLLALAGSAQAGQYFRLIDPSHAQVGAGFLISPKDPLATEGVTELAIVTHSTADGTIIPENWRGVLPPESWVPLQMGFGGSLRGDATIAGGSSANLAPLLAALALSKIDANASGFLAALKTALQGSGQGQVRIGGALAGHLVRAGVFQSGREAFPGRGLGEIIGNAGRLDFGGAWRF